MGNAARRQELLAHLDQLDEAQQEQVLRYVRTLATAFSRGVPGESMLRFAGTIEQDDLAQMSQAIEDGCEQVHLDE